MRTSQLMMVSVIGICALIIVGFTTIFPAMTPELEWSKTYGEQQSYHVYSLQQTSDGGYVMAGALWKSYPDWSDALLLKTDQSGAIQWRETYEGNHSDYLYAAQQTGDGGYMAVGMDYNGIRSDYYLLKVDSEGKMQWNKTYASNSSSLSTSVQQTLDGGFIIAGCTNFSRHFVIWLVKTDLNGNMMWNKTYPGTSGSPTSFGYGYSAHAEQTQDRGYIISGVTRIGSYPLLIKTDEAGNMEWNGTYSGSGAYYVKQTLDGGYVTVGTAGAHILLVKTHPNGSMQWSRTYDEGHTKGLLHGDYVGQTLDGGYIVAGGGVLSSLLIRTDANGSVQWSRTITEMMPADTFRTIDGPICVQQTSDGEYVLAATIRLNAVDSYGFTLFNIWFGRFKSSPPMIAVLGLVAWSITLAIVASACIVLTNKVQESATKATKEKESEKAVLTEDEAAEKWSRGHK